MAVPGVQYRAIPGDGHLGGRVRTLAQASLEIAAPFNVGARKRDQLRSFARDGKIPAAYGDTVYDILMLEIREQPVAVNLDKTLRQVVEPGSWRVLIESRNEN